MPSNITHTGISYHSNWSTLKNPDALSSWVKEFFLLANLTESISCISEKDICRTGHNLLIQTSPAILSGRNQNSLPTCSFGVLFSYRRVNCSTLWEYFWNVSREVCTSFWSLSVMIVVTLSLTANRFIGSPWRISRSVHRINSESSCILSTYCWRGFISVLLVVFMCVSDGNIYIYFYSYMYITTKVKFRYVLIYWL